MSMTLKAPAKVNLFLKVLEKRPDGYHTIETLFEKIALFDEIEIKKASGGINVTCDRSDLPQGRDNLVYKAAEAIESQIGYPVDVEIKIKKNIPAGAGLGGGSSDAAAVLSGINSLLGLGLSKTKLMSLAGTLGADVPFFVSDDTWGVGRARGDIIEPLTSAMKLWHILLVPGFALFTKYAYEWIDTRPQSSTEKDGLKSILAAVSANDPGSLGRGMRNDFEALSLERETKLKVLKDLLIANGAKGAMITGSGPTLFGIAGRKEEVIALKEKAEEAIGDDRGNWNIIIAPTLNDQ